MIKKITSSVYIIGKILEWMIFGVLIFLYLIVLSPNLPTKNYISTYIVQTGSMEPGIHTGSIALIQPKQADQVKKGDIIIFTSPKDPKQTILHRVFNIKQNDTSIDFETKGDNNNAPDNWTVPSISLKGVCFGSIPFVGHPAAFLKTPKGFTILFGIPALFLVILQIKKIREGIEEEVQKRVKKQMQKEKTTDVVSIIAILILTGLMSLITIQTVEALFVSKATISGVVFSVKDFAPPDAPTNLHWDNPSVSCGGVTNRYTITADWNDAFDIGGSGINHYEYNIIYPKIGGGTGNWTTTVIPSQYSGVFNADNGLHTYRVRAFDNEGNKSEWSHWCSIYYDNKAPIVSIGSGNAGPNGTRQNSLGLPEPIVNTPSNTSPTHGGIVSGIIPVYGTADDPHMLRYHVRIIKDGETESGKDWTAGNGYNKGGYAFTNVVDANLGTNVRLDFDSVVAGIQDFDTTFLANGTYWFIIGARDTLNQRNASNANQDPRIKFVIANAPPTPQLISPGNNTILNSDHLIQTWQQVSDGTSGAIYYDYESYTNPDLAPSHLRWSGTFSNSANGDGTVITKHAEGAPDGDVYWRVRSRNSIGSSIWSEVWHFNIDHTKPDASPVLPLDTPTSSVVLNEYLPNPIGLELAARPNGQWVELYNRSATSMDVLGWKLDDGINAHSLLITGARTNTGGTTILPHGFLVVYRNADPLFDVLVHNTVRLYNASSVLVDEYTYTGPSVPEGKSIGRYPDGEATWYDPIPSPGGPNVLEGDMEKILGTLVVLTPTPVTDPLLSLSLDEKTHTVSFTATGIVLFNKLTFVFSYDTDKEPQGIMGSVTLDGKSEFTKSGLLLGTCSSGGTCVYHEGVKNIKVTVTLKDIDGKERVLEKTL